MTKRKICIVSNNNKIVIPKAIADEINLSVGDTIYWEVENGKLVGTPFDLNNIVR